ncbi:DsbA family protein [Micrococcoides hystricis]|uniref:DsbA family protein n=1 Tax=Micrococcoides hystricis TaxID=1572761 RepID=A0ABV6PB11_9MICC
MANAKKSNQGQSARDRIRAQHESKQKAQKRNSLLLRVGVIALVLAVIGIVAIIIIGNSSRNIPDAGPAPAGATENGGINFVSNTAVSDKEVEEVTVEGLHEPSEEEFMANMENPKVPAGVSAATEGKTDKVVIYADPACGYCAEFEAQNSTFLEEKAAAGDIEVEYRTVGFLDKNSPTNFSARAANMLACVADTAPEKFMEVNAALYAGQAGGEKSDKELIELAQASDVDVTSCVNDNKFRPFVNYTTGKAREDMIPGTPTVYVNDKSWDAQQQPNFQEFYADALSETAKN